MGLARAELAAVWQGWPENVVAVTIVCLVSLTTSETRSTNDTWTQCGSRQVLYSSKGLWDRTQHNYGVVIQPYMSPDVIAVCNRPSI